MIPPIRDDSCPISPNVAQMSLFGGPAKVGIREHSSRVGFARAREPSSGINNSRGFGILGLSGPENCHGAAIRPRVLPPGYMPTPTQPFVATPPRRLYRGLSTLDTRALRSANSGTVTFRVRNSSRPVKRGRVRSRVWSPGRTMPGSTGGGSLTHNLSEP